MPNAFLRYLEHWLPATLRAKAIRSASEHRLHHIGASDLASLFSDYLLSELSLSPTACWTACELDHVTDAELIEATGCPQELLAAGFVGAVLELAAWQGDDGVAFLIREGVPPDDAREFVAALDVAAEKLGARGQALIHRLDAAPASLPAAAMRSA